MNFSVYNPTVYFPKSELITFNDYTLTGAVVATGVSVTFSRTENIVLVVINYTVTGSPVDARTIKLQTSTGSASVPTRFIPNETRHAPAVSINTSSTSSGSVAIYNDGTLEFFHGTGGVNYSTVGGVTGLNSQIFSYNL
jgi:hypothetical protein